VEAVRRVSVETPGSGGTLDLPLEARPAHEAGYRQPLGSWLWRIDFAGGICWLSFDGDLS
jgi:hypothetical protein